MAPAKTPGNLNRVGTGVPAAGIGGNGDTYTDLSTGRDWYKTAGAWGLVLQADLPYSKITGRPAIPADTYGTSLPASPVDGDFHTLVDSATNPSYQWKFRYNAGSSSAYKWEFVGGSPATPNAGSIITSSTTYVLLTGSGFTIVRAGDYWIEFGFLVYNTGGFGGAYSGYGQLFLNGAAIGYDARAQITSASGWYSVSSVVVLGNVPAGQVLDLRGRTDSVQSTGFGNTWMNITPRRVA